MGIFDDPIAVQQYNPSAGILGADAPMPQYDVSLKPVSDFSTALAKGMYESASIPANVMRGKYGMPSVDNPLLMDAAGQFTLDFGLLPAVGMSAIATPDPNTLRMGMGGSDTVSGGARSVPTVKRDVDDLGFYSQALETAKGFSQLKGTGDQYRAMLLKGGVKPDEITFTPELEGLLSQPQVTKDELVGLLQSNRIRPQETVYYGGDTPEFEGLGFPAEAEVLDAEQAYGRAYLGERTLDIMYEDPEYFMDAIGDLPSSTQYGEISDSKEDVMRALGEGDLNSVSPATEIFLKQKAERMVIDEYDFDPVLRLGDQDVGYEIVGTNETGFMVKDPDGISITDDYIGSIDEARVRAETDALDSGYIGMGGGDTRFMEYTEDGGGNYREMMLQVPEYAGKTDEFVYSGHFDEPDIVVHARTKDRDSANDVGDVLYVEELQSDFAQQGRRYGFKEGDYKERQEKAFSDYKKSTETLRKTGLEFKGVVENFAQEFSKKMSDKSGLDFSYNPDTQTVQLDMTPIMPEETLQRFGSEKVRPKDVFTSDQLSWMLKTGEPQAMIDPRGTSKIFLDEKELKSAIPKNSKEVIEKNKQAQDAHQEAYMVNSRMDKLIEPAPFVKNSQKFAEVGIKRLLNQAVKENKNYVSFSSGDVQLDRWNEQGLVPFYDEIIPKAAKKIVKRLDPDAKPDYMPIDDVEDFGGNMGTNRFTIEITPKMKEEILKGQQLFTAPNVPVPASGLLGNQPREVSVDNMTKEDLGLLIEAYDNQNALPQLQDILASQGVGLL